MQYSYKWLKELAGTTKNPDELAEMIGLKGFELEEKESLEERFKDFIVGEIISLDKHPNADKLQFVRVDIGGKQISEIVCGAHNIKKGDKVPVALPGSILPQNKLKIEKREVRGVVSNGMLCAEDELGLGKGHDGILILPKEAKAGESLCRALDMEDTIMDFDILPDRAHDCLSYEGMAREVTAMEGRQLKMKNEKLKVTDKSSESLSIGIEDTEGCPRYMGVVLKDVKVGKSPQWMQNALVASGMEPINNVVDITNYVMLEIGNPLHAFDFEKIKSMESKVSIVVRRAKKGETLELLDETNLELDEKDLVIANNEKALALAGIKGGKDSGISEDTTQIVLESANFSGFGVRKSRQKHALLTEAQARFEKGLSPELAERGLWRAVELLGEHAGAKLVEVVDENKTKKEEQVLNFEFALIKKLLGYEVGKEEAFTVLKNLGFEVDGTGDSVKVTVPYWRLDIEGPEDLVEEVGRIVGYEKISEQPITVPLSISKKNSQRSFEWKMRGALIGAGLDEVKNYSFYGPEDVKICRIPGEHFELEKPLSRELSLMRQSLLPGLLKNVAHNQKFFDEVGIFEIGRIFLQKADGEPEEKTRISSAVLSKDLNDERIFFKLKGSIESFFANRLGIEVFFQELSKSEDVIFHPTRSAQIVLEDVSKDTKGFPVAGRIGEINPVVAKKYGIKDRVVVFDLDFDALFKFSKKVSTYTPLRKYPSVFRDISMYVPLKTKVQDILAIIKNVGKDNLLKVDLFDVYVDKEKEKKSLAYHLEFGRDDRTLTSEEVEELMVEIIAGLGDEKAEVRKG